MILFLAAESPWPVHNGGRRRMAGLIGALREHDDVVVVAARHRRTPPPPADVVSLPPSGRSRLGALLGAGPFLGRGLLDAAGAHQVTALAARADTLVVSHSYLAPLLPELRIPVVLDLPNLEVARQRSSGSLLGRVEAVKAARWEPRAVRAATAVVAVDDVDAQAAADWGARQTLVVPNAAEATPCPPSPVDGYVLAVADWHYAPNAAGARHLLEQVWPQVLARAPTAVLVLAGRGSERYGGRGFVDDLDALHAGASAVVAPARDGGGTQLKIAEAVARGRVVVTTPHGARSIPEGAQPSCFVGDLADGLVAALSDVADRHAREDLLRRLPRLSWAATARPLIAWLEGPRA